jgi:intracellular sulfur oxidation DsrE/DsrF family protein
MAKQVLQIIDQGYRCTIEEQDDPAVWITHAMKGAGGGFGVLLRGSAVNYAVKGQNADGLRFGDKKQAHPPALESDVAKLVEKGITVYVVEDDAIDRGIEPSDLIGGIKPVARGGVAKLFADYDEIWHW